MTKNATSKTRKTDATSKSATPKATSESAPDKSRPVLLAVTGMSPAVITETLWALAHEPEPVLPARVIVLTTSTGRREIEQRLFQSCERFGGLSPWEALRQALEARGFDLADRLRFGTTADDLRVITGVDPATQRSRELADLRNPQDNEAAADFILEQVRAIVENPDTPLIASIAGGRKTMGALLYACMTLVGRETDRLTHVLVNEPYETLPEFWFPAQPGESLTDREGHPHPADQARVDLADVPFVPLRNLFRRELGRPAGSFTALVEDCREQIRHQVGENLRLIIETSRPEIEVNGSRVKVGPREHLVLLFLATRVKQGEPPLASYKEALAPLNEYRERLRESAPPNNWSDWRYADSLAQAFDESDDQDLRKLVSSLRVRLRRTGNNASALANCLPEKGRFSLTVPGSLIQIKD